MRLFNTKKPIVTQEDIAKGYAKRPSLAQYLPWQDYDSQHKVFLLEDNQSLAVCFRIMPLPCEARPTDMMAEIAAAFKDAIQNAIPFEKQNPWILQLFAQRTSDLAFVSDNIKNTIPHERHKEPLVSAHLETMSQHMAFMARPGGVFFDNQTQQLFKGGVWHIYAVLYRKVKHEKHTSKKQSTDRQNQLEIIQRVARKLSEQWRACGLGIKRLTGEDFFHWMGEWFNPKHITQMLYPETNQKPFGWDLSEQLFFSTPASFESGWLFDEMPHKVVTVQHLMRNPEIGHLTAERPKGTDDKLFNFFDHLPEGSVFSMAIVLQAQSEVELHLKNIHNSAVGRHALAMKVKDEVESAEHAIADGDYLLPLAMAVYIRGEDTQQLQERESQIEVLLSSNGFKVITDDELYPIDAYMRYLPMCYDFAFDRKKTYRSRYVFLSDIAKLLPLYGRSRGTSHPGMVMFNRGGEPWYYDILQDRTKNAHILLLGETGTGKSNLLNFLIIHNIALYNPRFFIIDAGGSFDLLASYCKDLGKTINKVKIDPKHPVSLNPFSDGLRVLEQLAALNAIQREQWLEKQDNRLTENLVDDAESRDILGDMVLAALAMITGGEKKEEDRITRSDRMLIMDTIIHAAEQTKRDGKQQMLASDVVTAFETIAQTLDPQRDDAKIRRAREMADSMRYFVSDPVSSQFFNTYGDPWPTVDITVIDFGLFAQEGYEAQRSIAFCGVFNKIQNLAEANQYGQRPLIAVLDENHLFSKLPLLAAVETRVAKMGRKLGLWLWIATQNLKDFAEEARKMLSLIEHWICLALPPDEINQIVHFKPLTPEQHAQCCSARKEKGKYTEAVLLSPCMQAIFRVIAPKLYLVMAATEQHEKNARLQLMQKLHCSELEVLAHQAKALMQKPIEEWHDD